jgi:uncharacterized protein YdeI (YjbR/CyaY-like superfamily)
MPEKLRAELPVLPFASQAKWRDWLTEYHGQSAGVWLKLAKKGSDTPSVTYAEALDVALCFGWIDGQKRLAMTLFGCKNSHHAGPRVSGQKSIPRKQRD